MKDYKQVSASVFRKAEERMAEKKRRAVIIKRNVLIASGLAAVLLAGVGIWKNDSVRNAAHLDPHESDISIITESSTTTDLPEITSVSSDDNPTATKATTTKAVTETADKTTKTKKTTSADKTAKESKTTKTTSSAETAKTTKSTAYEANKPETTTVTHEHISGSKTTSKAQNEDKTTTKTSTNERTTAKASTTTKPASTTRSTTKATTTKTTTKVTTTIRTTTTTTRVEIYNPTSSTTRNTTRTTSTRSTIATTRTTPRTTSPSYDNTTTRRITATMTTTIAYHTTLTRTTGAPATTQHYHTMAPSIEQPQTSASTGNYYTEPEWPVMSTSYVEASTSMQYSPTTTNDSSLTDYPFITQTEADKWTVTRTYSGGNKVGLIFSSDNNSELEVTISYFNEYGDIVSNTYTVNVEGNSAQLEASIEEGSEPLEITISASDPEDIRILTAYYYNDH